MRVARARAAPTISAPMSRTVPEAHAARTASARMARTAAVAIPIVRRLAVRLARAPCSRTPVPTHRTMRCAVVAAFARVRVNVSREPVPVGVKSAGKIRPPVNSTARPFRGAAHRIWSPLATRAPTLAYSSYARKIAGVPPIRTARPFVSVPWTMGERANRLPNARPSFRIACTARRTAIQFAPASQRGACHSRSTAPGLLAEAACAAIPELRLNQISTLTASPGLAQSMRVRARSPERSSNTRIGCVFCSSIPQMLTEELDRDFPDPLQGDRRRHPARF